MVLVISFVIICQLDHFRFADINSPQTAGEVFALTIYAEDAQNNIYPYTGPAQIFATPGPQYGSATINFNDGIWQGQFTVTLADTYTISCQDYSSPPHTGQSEAVVFVSNSASKLLCILPGQTYYPGIDTGKIGNPTPQLAGEYFDVSVYLTDYWANLIYGADDSFRVQTSDPFIPEQGYSLVNGSGSFQYAFRTAKTQEFYLDDVSNGSIKSDTSSKITIYPAAFSKLLLLFPGEEHLPGDTTKAILNTPGKSGTAEEQYEDDTFSVLVYTTDSMWNKTMTSGPEVSLYSDFPFSNPAPESLALGEVRFSVSFTNSGDNQNLWAMSDTIQSYRNYLDILPRLDTTIAAESLIVYPNPMGIESPIMNIMYNLNSSCNVIFAIYDPFGNLVRSSEISAGSRGAMAGNNLLHWDGRNEKGKRVASGVYYLVIKGYTHTATIFEKRMKIGVAW